MSPPESSAADPQTASAIDARRAHLAARITERQFREQPELQARYGAAGRAKCIQDAEFHLAYLSQALALGAPQLFSEYLGWAASVLASRGIPAVDLHRNLRMLEAVLREELPGAQPSVQAVITPALQGLPVLPLHAPGPAALPSAPQRYLDAALHGGPAAAAAVIDELIGGGLSVREIYVEVLQAAQHEIGRLWQANRISVAEEHYCTAVTQRVIARLYATLFKDRAPGPVVVGACIAGELHELGPRMVCDLLELDGFDAHYLGASTPPAAVVEFACARGARLLALSASLTPHLGPIADTIRLVRRDARCREIKVLVGGSAFNMLPSVWRSVGADGWARDALGAGAEAKRLIG